MTQENSSAATQKWQWRTTRDNVKIYAGSIAGVTLFGLGLTQVFNPVALTAAGVYAGYKVIRGIVAPNVRPAVRNKFFKDAVAKGRLTPLEEDSAVAQLVKDISQQAGIDKTPTTYIADQKLIKESGKSSIDWEWRWILSVPGVGKKLIDKAMTKTYAALPGLNAVITTREALAESRPESELRFAFAHEVGHLKADRLSPVSMARTLVQNTAKALFIGCAAAALLPLAGISLPVTLGSVTLLQAAAAVYGLRLLSKFGTRFANRTAEKRADRNAMYITRNFDAGKSMLEYLTGEPTGEKGPEFMETLDSYPSLPYRIESLKKSYDKACTYPRLPGTPDPTPSVTPEPVVNPASSFFTEPDKPALSWSEKLKTPKA